MSFDPPAQQAGQNDHCYDNVHSQSPCDSPPDHDHHHYHDPSENSCNACRNNTIVNERHALGRLCGRR
jgi:hypothetical protein